MNEKYLNEGWKCPVCKKVYSPSVKSCEECSMAENKDKQAEKLLEE